MPFALNRALAREINPSRLAAAAWRWWADEMRATVGELGGRLLGFETRIVEIAADGWILRRETPGGVSRERVEPERLAAGGSAVVEVAASAALRKTLRLPAAARENLDAVLAFEIGRLTPFAADQVYLRFDIVGRGAGGEIEVALTVVPREHVDAALARLAALGVAVSAVCVAGTPAHERRRCNLAVGPRARSALWTPLNRALLGVLFVAALGAAAAPIVAGHRRAAASERELAALRPLVENARAEQERRAQGAARREELAAAAAGGLSTVRLLADLTHAVPDGSWLTAFAMNGREVTIDGLSPSAAALPQALEAIEGVARVIYAAPVTRDPQTGRERFQFTLQLGKKPG
jgi:general secretion pathway protein L